MKTSFEITKEIIQSLERDLKEAKRLLMKYCLHEIVMRKYIGGKKYCFVCKACGKIFKDWEEVGSKGE